MSAGGMEWERALHKGLCSHLSSSFSNKCSVLCPSSLSPSVSHQWDPLSGRKRFCQKAGQFRSLISLLSFLSVFTHRGRQPWWDQGGQYRWRGTSSSGEAGVPREGWADWSSACGYSLSNCLSPFSIFHSHQTFQGDDSIHRRGQIHTSLSFTISSLFYMFLHVLHVYMGRVFSQPHAFRELVGAQWLWDLFLPLVWLPVIHQLLRKAHAQAKYHHSCLISLGNLTTNIQLLLFLCTTKPKATIPVLQTTIHHRADISAGLIFLQCPLSPGWRATPRQAHSQLCNGTNSARMSAQAVFPWLYF